MKLAADQGARKVIVSSHVERQRLPLGHCRHRRADAAALFHPAASRNNQ
jgi:hypothetical protein